MKTVIVLGGGIAGLAASVRLAEKGYKIKLIEKRSVLGGRASSFIEPETGEWVDNCQHVLMKCCTNLLDFYCKIGVEDKIHWYDTFYFIDKEKKISRIKSSNLPAPFHLLPSLLSISSLTLRDKMGILYGFLCMLIQDENRNPKLDKITMEQWLKSHHQTENAIDFFWRPILVSALNEEIEISSAKYAFKLFRLGFLLNRNSYEMGIPSIRLSELYSQPSIDFLQKYDGEIYLKKSATQIDIQNNIVEKVILSDGSVVRGDYYLSALPFDSISNLLTPDILSNNAYFTKFNQLKVSPITGIHLWFEKDIFELEHATTPFRTIQWIFNKARNFQSADKPILNKGYLGLVVSASRNLSNKSREEIIGIALDELNEIIPNSNHMKPLKSIVIKETKATFSPSPGCDEFRPDQRSPISNLYIAGDWTKTGWPGTMESAVISGFRCADYIINDGKQ